jgi:hypothetical protein
VSRDWLQDLRGFFYSVYLHPQSDIRENLRAVIGLAASNDHVSTAMFQASHILSACKYALITLRLLARYRLPGVCLQCQANFTL